MILALNGCYFTGVGSFFMLPEIALIKTEKSGYEFSKKIGGLFPLERNIKLLVKAGIKKIILDLSAKENAFYLARIAKGFQKLENIEIIVKSNAVIKARYFSIPSNLFSQVHYYKEFQTYFKLRDNIYKPVIRNDQFMLAEDSHYQKALALMKAYIIGNTGGFIAQKINKKFSMPVSLVIVKTGIHPNYLTIINMLIGISSSFFLLLNTYSFTVLGGFLFQLASVLDGVDGEVAKLSLKVSKIGGWLDTIGDNLTLILFISAASYLYFIHTGGLLSLLVIVAVFLGIVIMLAAMIRFLRWYSESGSLVAYDKEFLQKLPQNDFFVRITQKLKYITKKECFSIVFFVICLTGKIIILVPVIAVVIFFAAIVLVIIDIKYLKNFKTALS
jgi:phosphatidylglycerophosphate synthase